MPTIPCEIAIRCPGGVAGSDIDSDSPVTNLSAEGPDISLFEGTGWPIIGHDDPIGPVIHNGGGHHEGPRTRWWALGCISLCSSTISQEAANACARAQAFLCANRGDDGGSPPIIIPGNDPDKVFYNGIQQCAFKCPDGTLFVSTIAPGYVVSDSQVKADRIAFEIACQRAARDHICLGDLATDVCLGGTYSSSTVPQGGIPPFAYEIVAGTLPPGLTMLTGTDKKTLKIQGTPTAAGTYAFTIQATAGTAFVQKNYTITVNSAVSNCPLPDGHAESKYSQQLTAPGVGAGSIFSLVTGSLPAGLTLSTSGLVSGYPTAPGTSTFTVSVLDSNTGKTCDAQCSITILAACGPLWSQIVWTPLQTLSGAPTGSASGQQVTMGAAGTVDPAFPLVSNGQFHGTLNYNGPAAKLLIHISSVSNQPGVTGGATTFTLGIIWGPNFNALLYDQPVVPPEVGPGTYDLVFNMPGGAGIITINVTCTAGTIGAPAGPCSVVGRFDLSNDCS